MFGLTAAPEIAIAVPSVMPPAFFPAYSQLGRKPLSALPQCRGLTVNGSALRSCQASRLASTTLSEMLSTWKRPNVFCPSLVAFCGPRFMGVNIIAGVEAGEAIRVARLTRRAQVAAGESVSVDRVQREAVYVHVLRCDDFDGQCDSYTHHEVEDNR